LPSVSCQAVHYSEIQHTKHPISVHWYITFCCLSGCIFLSYTAHKTQNICSLLYYHLLLVRLYINQLSNTQTHDNCSLLYCHLLPVTLFITQLQSTQDTKQLFPVILPFAACQAVPYWIIKHTKHKTPVPSYIEICCLSGCELLSYTAQKHKTPIPVIIPFAACHVVHYSVIQHTEHTKPVPCYIDICCLSCCTLLSYTAHKTHIICSSLYCNLLSVWLYITQLSITQNTQHLFPVILHLLPVRLYITQSNITQNTQQVFPVMLRTVACQAVHYSAVEHTKPKTPIPCYIATCCLLGCKLLSYTAQ